MTKWKNIQINIQNIKHDTGKAVLIACPHKSKWDGWMFWHPSKLVRYGYHAYASSIGYTDDFTFRLKRYGKNNNVLEERTISVEEFEDMLSVMNENIKPKAVPDENEKHVPEYIEPIVAVVDDELVYEQ